MSTITRLLLACLFLAAPAARAAPADGVGVDEHLGASVPLDLAFTGADGRRERLRDLFRGDLPVVLVLYYDRCPMLCGLVLNAATDAIRAQESGLGRGFRALTVSFDPRERPEEARRRQTLSLERAGAPGEADAWPFLTGDEGAIGELARSVGYTYRLDPSTGQYAHPAAIAVLTPDGKISRYLYGIRFDPMDLRLAIAEASQGRSGPTLDRFILRCYRYDPASRRYELAVTGVLRAGGLIVLAALAALLWRITRASARRARLDPEP